MTDSINEQFADEIRLHAIDILQVTSLFYREEILTILLTLEKRLVKKMEDVKLEKVTKFQSQRVQELLAFARDSIETSYTRIGKKADIHLLDIALAERDFLKSMFKEKIGVDMLTNVPTLKQLEGIVKYSLVSDAPSSGWWDRQSEVTKKKFESTIKSGMAEGETIDGFIRRVAGSKATGFTDGIMNISRRDAEALIRSSVATVQNKTRLETFVDNEDIFKGYVQISTLDSRTSEVCIAYSGKMWDTEFQPVGHDLPFNGGPPRHWRCRSTLVPVMKSFRELGINANEIPKTTRASMDGQVPVDITFDKWLKGKSNEFQNNLLGIGKAELFRQNKINLTDLIDSTGKRVLTLEQLRAKIEK